MIRTCKDCPTVLPAPTSSGRPRERCDACHGIHAREMERERKERYRASQGKPARPNARLVKS